MICIKCQSRNVYEQAGEYACMMCGKRWPVAGTVQIAPITITDVEEKREEIMVATNRKAACKNCGRNMTIQSHGRCGGCNNAIRGLKAGSPEYIKALADAKTRFNQPGFKYGNRYTVKRKSPALNTAAAPAKPETRPVKSQPVHENKIDAACAMANIIDKLRAERDFHLNMMEKCQKAISALNP